tara:strand:- start:14813 stop:14941 length:129 start_codon:yes stop_codon:yes gene_type:complete
MLNQKNDKNNCPSRKTIKNNSSQKILAEIKPSLIIKKNTKKT